MKGHVSPTFALGGVTLLGAVFALATVSPVAAAAESKTHDTWAMGTALPSPLTWSTAAVFKNKIYVIGGIDASQTAVAATEVFDPASNTWSAGVPLPVPLWGATAVATKSAIYVFGGYDGTTASKSVYEFNVKKNKWIAKAPMLSAQGSARAVLDETVVYVIGGNTTSQERINTVESYDIATDTWTVQAPLLVGKSELSAGLVGTDIVAADGYASGGDTGDNEYYVGGKWNPIPSDPTHRNGACTGVIGAGLIISDGNDNSNNPISVNETYNLETSVWKSLAAMPHAVTDSSFAVYKNKLYCIGGGASAAPFQGTVYSDVQIYTP